jgi:predicted ribosomally synthesized peptide with SipW-like signal peptide
VGGSTGTFASFNAQVTNPGNTFATGTLFLHDTAGSPATTCTSESAPGNNNDGSAINEDACATIFTPSNQTGRAQQPTYQLTLANAGTLPATDVKFYASTCVPSSVGQPNGTVGTGSATTNVNLSSPTTIAMPTGSQVSFGSATGTKYTTSGATALGAGSITLTTTPSGVTNGQTVYYFPAFQAANGNLCHTLGLTIYDMDQSTSTDPSGGTCVYPLTACTTTPTLFDSLPDSTGPVALNGVTLAAGAHRNFLVQINEPDLDNSFQSQQAKLDLTWHIDD